MARRKSYFPSQQACHYSVASRGISVNAAPQQTVRTLLPRTAVLGILLSRLQNTHGDVVIRSSNYKYFDCEKGRVTLVKQTSGKTISYKYIFRRLVGCKVIAHKLVASSSLVSPSEWGIIQKNVDWESVRLEQGTFFSSPNSWPLRV